MSSGLSCRGGLLTPVVRFEKLKTSKVFGFSNCEQRSLHLRRYFRPFREQKRGQLVNCCVGSLSLVRGPGFQFFELAPEEFTTRR